MAALISHFPVPLEANIQPFSPRTAGCVMLLPLWTWQLSQQLTTERPITSSDPVSCQDRIWARKMLPGLTTASAFIYPRLQQTWLQKTGNRASSQFIMIPVITMEWRLLGSKAGASPQGSGTSSLRGWSVPLGPP